MLSRDTSVDDSALAGGAANEKPMEPDLDFSAPLPVGEPKPKPTGLPMLPLPPPPPKTNGLLGEPKELEEADFTGVDVPKGDGAGLSLLSSLPSSCLSVVLLILPNRLDVFAEAEFRPKREVPLLLEEPLREKGSEGAASFVGKAKGLLFSAEALSAGGVPNEKVDLGGAAEDADDVSGCVGADDADGNLKLDDWLPLAAVASGPTEKLPPKEVEDEDAAAGRKPAKLVGGAGIVGSLGAELGAKLVPKANEEDGTAGGTADADAPLTAGEVDARADLSSYSCCTDILCFLYCSSTPAMSKKGSDSMAFETVDKKEVFRPRREV